MATDEFRVEVNLDDEAHGHPFSERLAALDLDDEVAAQLGDRVIVTRDGPRMFIYTASREACATAEQVVKDTLVEDGLYAEIRATRWNASTGEWQDADAPLEETGTAPDYAAEAEEEGVSHPLFVYIEGHEPRFMRDLGV
ncbi:MAG TPA: hypothetical protein VHF58_10405 [Solirubrobacterales bacterium]|nr:hypothetical protein [Solirubrobacterales bacterium]